MAHQQNKQLAENFMNDVWTEHNADNLDQYVSDDYVEHTPFGDFHGIDEFRGYLNMVLRGFPDFEVQPDNIIADENLIACNYTTTGTHENEFMGVDPTGNYQEVDGCFVGRIENGKLVEAWNQFDMLTVLTGLELIPRDMLGELQGGAGGIQQPGTRQ